MKEIHNPDSPLISFLSFLSDLMILNVLTLLCCIPVLTIGPAITAMHYVLFRIRKCESGSVFKVFLYAFKNNFCQAISLWIIYLVLGIIILIDTYLIYYGKMQLSICLRPGVYLTAVLLIMNFVWAFPLLSRFNNNIIRTIINACYLGIARLPHTIAIVTLGVAPILLLAVCPSITPIILLVGFSLAGYLQSFVYSLVFEKIECSVSKE